MNKNIKLAPTIEISSALLTPLLTEADLQNINQNPKTFLQSKLNLNAEKVEVQIAFNNANEVNLALPYYSGLENLQAEMLKDQNLDDITGGEIIIALGITVGATVGWGLGFSLTSAAIGGVIGGALAGTAAVIVGATTAAAVQAADDKNIDGSDK